MSDARANTFRATHIKPPWVTPAISYPRGKRGVAEIRDWKLRPGIYDMYGVNGTQFFELAKPIITTNLLIRRKVWMVDDPPHWWAMKDHALHYSGNVLCAGLGLGLIVHALDENPLVDHIEVIEREKDVIDLVGPLCPQRKLNIVHGDFWDDWDAKPDGVFYDLFVGDGRDLLPEAVRVWFQLHEKFPGTVRRIHGFKNEELQSLDALIERL